MKEIKLKRLSLASLLAGYLLAVSFILLIVLNLKSDEPSIKLLAKPNDLKPYEFNNTAIEEKIVYVDREVFVPSEVTYDPSVIYKDRLSGVVLGDDTIRTVVRGQSPEIFVQEDDGLVVYNNSRAFGASETIVNGGINEHRIYDRNINSHSDYRDNVVDNGKVLDEDIDYGLLDRRLKDLQIETDTIGINKIKERNGLNDKDGINFGNLSLANRDEGELGDLEDLDFNPEKGPGYGVGKGGELYAYNFPSQGVGAGIGSGGVGAAGSVAAGLGAGIGEGVAGGETVPTLGGVGTYRSVQTVPPGTGTDFDKDGLPAESEAALGTDPNKADSDGDGYSDGAEATSYTDPKNASSNPGVPGAGPTPGMGGVGGLVGGAGAGGAAGLITGMVKKPLGIGAPPASGCTEHGAGCKGHHGAGHYNYDHLPKDGALHIMMHVDGSGSILDTRKQLEVMKDTLLKDALLPYYNNDEALYNKRVTIVDGNGERTLQFFTQATKTANVLALVFQDEAAPAYHLPTFNKKPQDHYAKDLQKLKAGLNRYGGLYRGVMFQVDRGKTFAKSFKEFVECAWQGTGYLENSNLRKYYWQENKQNIKSKNGIVFSDEYHAKDSGDPEYYLNLIFNASKKIGLDLDIYGAGLTDGKNTLSQ